MIFAFLFGLSMDYEVFMLTRMREAYDETGDTNQAIELGLARTGKLVTSAALILMFAFLVLSSSPGLDIKQFGIGLAAGIIFDATVIRALLVPSVMAILGKWNWWLPSVAAKALFLRTRESAPTRFRAVGGLSSSLDSVPVCGICGIVSSRGRVDRKRLAAMSATLVHRGPGLRGDVRRRAASGSRRGGSRSSTSRAATSRSRTRTGRARSSRTARSTTTPS